MILIVLNYIFTHTRNTNYFLIYTTNLCYYESIDHIALSNSKARNSMTLYWANDQPFVAQRLTILL